MKKFVESNVPENIKVHVVHLHRGNSSNNRRYGHDMVTIAELCDKNTGLVVARGEAFCSKKDSPSRRTGRQVAVGRALSHLAKGA